MRLIDDIYRSYQALRGFPHRPHLGASQIGNPCERALWYQFHWAAHATFDGRILRLFDTGNREEVRLIEDLRRVGVTVWEIDESTGRQWRFDLFGGHFGLSLDGVCDGTPDQPDTMTLEFKTMNDKTFKVMVLNGLEKAKPVYWSQVQIGMHMSGIGHCLFMAVNKNTDDIYAEIVKPDGSALGLINKAERIVFSAKPLVKLGESEDWFECKFCDFAAICHRDELPETNCRTCAHSTAEPDGTWSCAARGIRLDIATQQIGCDRHVFNPALINMEIHDTGEGWVEYVNSDGEILRNEKREWR
jgi:hypothetical protein